MLNSFVIFITFYMFSSDQPRSAVSVRGRGNYNRRGVHQGPGYDGYNRSNYQSRNHQPQQQPGPQERRFPSGYGYNRSPMRGRPQERRLPPAAMRYTNIIYT